MKAIILHQSIIKHDAIGNDIYNMYLALNSICETYVHCDHLNFESLQKIDKNQLNSFIANKENLVIYHHSQFWEEGEHILRRTKAKILFKYHNITPEHFYQGYDPDAAFKCKKGRAQTNDLIYDHPEAFWMGDSLYNLEDIKEVRQERKVVVPPFNNIDKWTTVVPDNATLKDLLENKTINLLFVGRVVPNKGHKFIMRVLRDYVDHYGPQIKLNIIGKRDECFSGYHEELDAFMRQLNLAQKVRFVGAVDDRIMLAYYLGSDFFLCGSEHEGFCIPLVEAQFCHLPVVARRSSAVGETLGNDQLVLTEDIREYSSSIKVLSDNEDYKKFIMRKGYENYRERFSHSKISVFFKDALDAFTGVKI